MKQIKDTADEKCLYRGCPHDGERRVLRIGGGYRPITVRICASHWKRAIKQKRFQA